MHNPFEQVIDEIKEIKSLMFDLQETIKSNQPLRRYSPQDIAANTPIGIQTVRTAIKDGRIKAEKFGHKYLITSEEFQRVCKEAKSLKYKRA